MVHAYFLWMLGSLFIHFESVVNANEHEKTGRANQMMTDIACFFLALFMGVCLGLYMAGKAIASVIEKDVRLFGYFRIGNTVYKAEKQEGWDG